ncbi:MAG: phosphoethanolamine transferase [Prevotella sp.]|jgi:heptose-I-phosphate ethanolaminephosphotransferase
MHYNKPFFHYISTALSLIFEPLRINGTFFVFMYALGVACSWLDHTMLPYRPLYAELFVDIYVLCVILAVLPGRVRLWTRRIFYVILYAVAFLDVYCIVEFDSTISPSILMLMSETDPREASEFLTTFLDPSLIATPLGWLLLLLLIHVLFTLRHKLWRVFRLPSVKLPTIRWRRNVEGAVAGVLVIVLLVVSWQHCAANKRGVERLLSASSLGTIEKLLAQRGHGVMYEPIYRLAFSLHSNALANQQVNTLMEASKSVRIDSCTFTTPRIVLIIGESYGRHHSQLYGYRMPTNPRQKKLMRRGELIRFSDVVTPWNLTSYVFKNVLSMHVFGQEGEWCDYPLIPQLFRKAGYHVTFLTNQFLPKPKEELYDFSGGFFLNNSTLSKLEFDTRNTQLHKFDEGLIKEYEQLKRYDTAHNLTIFHLLGLHVKYRDRYPADRRRFTADDYEWRKELSKGQRSTLADYDNAVLYNDSIVTAIIHQFVNDDAIVIYMPDHGEECYEENRGFICRLHSARIDYKLARYEFEIPFWVWGSQKFRQRHNQLWQTVRAARDRKWMIDALPYMMLHLAGIYTPLYHPEYDLLSPQYNEDRPRLLKNSVDYDSLRP